MVNGEKWDEGHIFLKHTDKQRTVYYTEHHCWSVERFMSMCVTAEADVGTKCERVTRQDYEAARAKRGRSD